MADLSNVRVDGARLWDSLMEMAKIGATPKGGCKRLTLTDLDREAREHFRSWCEAAGCTVKVDKMGNMFARRPGEARRLFASRSSSARSISVARKMPSCLHWPSRFPDRPPRRWAAWRASWAWW